MYICHIMHIGKETPVLRKFFILNKHQKSVLERSYAVCYYPSKTTRKYLANQTGLKESVVSNWFSGKRRRDPQKKGERTVSTLSRFIDKRSDLNVNVMNKIFV